MAAHHSRRDADLPDELEDVLAALPLRVTLTGGAPGSSRSTRPRPPRAAWPASPPRSPRPPPPGHGRASRSARSGTCRWAFLDTSKNRSRAWCSMSVCGNRTKTRAYRGAAKAPGGLTPAGSLGWAVIEGAADGRREDAQPWPMPECGPRGAGTPPRSPTSRCGPGGTATATCCPGASGRVTGPAAAEAWRERWRQAATDPPSPRHRLLVAVASEPRRRVRRARARRGPRPRPGRHGRADHAARRPGARPRRARQPAARRHRRPAARGRVPHPGHLDLRGRRGDADVPRLGRMGARRDGQDARHGRAGPADPAPHRHQRSLRTARTGAGERARTPRPYLWSRARIHRSDDAAPAAPPPRPRAAAAGRAWSSSASASR